MLDTPTAQEREAMKRLTGDPNFKVFAGWLDRSRDKLRSRWENGDPLAAPMSGGSKVLAVILGECANARNPQQVAPSSSGESHWF